jgi:putative colanic acid biosynthesis UDP-glucose lipid carrier transferase
MFRAETSGGAPKPFAQALWAGTLPRKNRLLVRGGFSLLAALADFLAILASGVLARLVYVAAGVAAGSHIRLGLLVSVLFTFMSAMRDEYAITKYLTFEHQVRRSVLPWFMAVVGALVISLSAKPLAGSTTLALMTFFLGGFCTLNLTRLCVTYGIRARARSGRLAVRRIFLLGYEEELHAFTKGHEPWLFGIHVIAASVLRGPVSLQEDLALALASARILEPDDVFILVPWSEKKVIDAAIQALLRIPASIHLGSERVLDRFTDVRVSKIGRVSSLNLVRDPLSPSEVIAKRLLDILLATFALILLAPLFVIVAIAIKLDSPAPIVFRQRRYGFNQQPFRMFKLRSMHTLEDDSKLTPVCPNDVRVTVFGNFMRRHNIDELPQLLNVLRGEMSLVGPRPHALAIDQKFEQRIALYARRHNVKPGITGWAQINGFRGAMNEERMRARVEHDLYYIDHWSMWLDIEILWLTLTSKKAYTNAL